MRTKPMAHQRTALKELEGRAYFGLFMEQGTGKTWCLLADAERLYLDSKINAMLIIAPNGVHTNWIRREIPQHVSVPYQARSWRSNASKKHAEWVQEIFEPTAIQPLRFLAINIEALITKPGLHFAQKFLRTYRCMIIVDESSRIKNPDAGRTRAVFCLRPLASYARIASGTPVTNAPVDVFAQMEFLHSGLLKTTSYRAFVAEYAELMKPDHPMMQRMIERNPRIARAQVVARDAQGRPKWRNLAKLQKLLDPHTYRVRKDECLDLPAKIYTQHFFTLTLEQRKAYHLMKQERRMALQDELIAVDVLGAGTKLQQITSGFLLHEGQAHYIEDGNPRLAALMTIIEDLTGPFIIWARFREEIHAILQRLRKEEISAVTYFGDTTQKDRESAIDQFQQGTVQAFIANQQTAGMGLTLTAAQTAIYYSNDFNLAHRLQSEDRCHRKGTTHHVVYIDLIAEHTIDETIVRALQTKADMAAAIVGDLNS